MSDNNLIKASISMNQDVGAFCVYGMYELEKIIRAGAHKYGYTVDMAHTCTVSKILDEVYPNFEAVISIQPKEKRG